MKKEKVNKSNVSRMRKGRKDTFHEFMIKNADFDGYWEFPIVPDNVYSLPTILVPYDQRKKCKDLEETKYIHFFVDDYKFDGPNGIWNGSSKNFEQLRGFSIASLKSYDGIIGPDFTMGYGFPLCTQLDCCRRRRYFEYWMTTLGFQVIPFVRWTDERSFDFCFLGLTNGGIVAISTFGSMKVKFLKDNYKKGLVELLKRVEPRIIVVYGKLYDDIFDIVDQTKIKIIHFESDISVFRGDKNGR